MKSHLLRTMPSSTPAMLSVFDDLSTLQHALAFEAALARAKAAAGLISAETADRIVEACSSLEVNAADLATDAAHAGTLAIPLVARLRESLGDDGEALDAVHKGATSQDLSDTVMMLQLRDAVEVLRVDLRRITAGLASLARRYAGTAAVGRTLLQDALPVTFGLRAAQWFAGVQNATRRFDQACAEEIVLQFGGAVGSLAGLGGLGRDIHNAMAQDLGLIAAIAPWHARRDGVATLASCLAVIIGMIGKVARDITLLSQNAIGEASEPMLEGRGGSSAMSHKRNPTGCQVALSAANRAPGFVSSILAGLPQEQERGLGGWQAEWSSLAELFMLAGASAEAMAVVVEGLEVHEDAIRRNLEAAGIGTDTGDAATIVEAILASAERNTDAICRA